MWINYNPNPRGARVGDCAVRAVCMALDLDWTDAFANICIEGIVQCDMPSSNAVWGEFLRANGFRKGITEERTTVKEFADAHRSGTYVAALSGHVVTIKDGEYFDTWDSGDECLIYYWEKERRKK